MLSDQLLKRLRTWLNSFSVRRATALIVQIALLEDGRDLGDRKRSRPRTSYSAYRSSEAIPTHLITPTTSFAWLDPLGIAIFAISGLCRGSAERNAGNAQILFFRLSSSPHRILGPGGGLFRHAADELDEAHEAPLS